MEKIYELKNINSDSFRFDLDNKLNNDLLKGSYSFDNDKNLLYIESDEESMDNDYQLIRSAILSLDSNIEILPYIEGMVYRKIVVLKNIDCANCARKIEEIAEKTFDNEMVRLDFATSRFIIETKDKDLCDNLEERLLEVTKQVDRNIEIVYENAKKVDIEKENDVNKILFFIGSGLFLIEVLLHYLILPRFLNGYTSEGIISIKYWYVIVLCGISYLCLGGDILLGALNNIKAGRIFDEKFLMSIASIAAFAIGSYIEAGCVMIFYKIGEILQDYVINKSRSSIAGLVDIKPAMARLLIDGKETEVSPNKIVVGDIILVKQGEKIPVDGYVISGEASLDVSALTGESQYQLVQKNSHVISGAINIDGELEIKVLKKYQDSMVSKILDLVENANINKGKTEKFISKFAKYYTPIVCALAVIIIVLRIILSDEPLHNSIYNGLLMLVVSCPCALVLSVPLSYFGAIGGASKKGILIKGSTYLEAMNNVGRVIFDKTGTLTKNKLKITNIVSVSSDYSDEDIFKFIAYCESTSTHPIANSIVEAYGKSKIDINLVEIVKKNKTGSIVKIENDEFIFGNYLYLKENRVKLQELDCVGNVVYLALNGKYIGHVILTDEIREDALPTIKELKKMGIEIAMLTGDNEKNAEYTANKLGIDTYYANLSPIEKVKKLRKLKKMLPEGKNQIFVGDGINDAPVLSNVDIGIAMGSLGSDAAIEVSDVVIMNDDLSKIPLGINMAKKTRRIVIQNIAFALTVKFIALIISSLVLGVPLMWMAIFADVGVAVLATLNSLRCANIGYDELFKIIYEKDMNNGR